MADTPPLYIVIIGAGGHGSEVHSYLHDLRVAGEDIRFVGFIDEAQSPGPWEEARILGGFEALEALLEGQPDRTFHYITAIGDNGAREEFTSRAEGLRARNLRAWTLRHPQAVIGERVVIGEGTCVAPGVVVTTHVTIGRHCILNVRCSISHDCELDDFVNINPGAILAGNVHAGKGSFIGAGATIIQRLNVGDEAIIGAGATVIDDIPPRVTAVGVPARIRRYHDSDGVPRMSSLTAGPDSRSGNVRPVDPV